MTLTDVKLVTGSYGSICNLHLHFELNLIMLNGNGNVDNRTQKSKIKESDLEQNAHLLFKEKEKLFLMFIERIHSITGGMEKFLSPSLQKFLSRATVEWKGILTITE